MKRYILILASAMMILGCSRINVAEQTQTPVPDGEMPVWLSVEGLQAQTKSYVSGEEKAITSIKMICFDAQGKYITVRDAELTQSSTTPPAGTLKGHVPDNTARIHFIANFADMDLSEFGMGQLEASVMKSAALSSGITDDIRFWGFHGEETVDAMKTWLNRGNTVMLLRDRAKVTVVNEDPNITKVRWTIVNGLNRGYVAALPFANEYTDPTKLQINEYRSSGVYNPAAVAENLWVEAGADKPQFLFENINNNVPVKLIVEATFKAAEGETPEVRYHTLLLQNDQKVRYDVSRNASFRLTIKHLPSVKETASMGSGSYADAVTTENYSNNQFAQIDKTVNEISTSDFKLTVEKVINMFDKADAAGNGVVNFKYTALGDGSTEDLDETNFTIRWLGKEEEDKTPHMADVTTPATVSYDPESGKGTVTFKMATVSNALKYSSFEIVANNTGLNRYVDLYSITSFVYSADPTLTDTGRTRTTGTGGESVERRVYKLDFQLDPNYPKGLYPVTVKLYTSSLSPYSDQGEDAPHGSFKTVVGDTSDLQETSQTTSWNHRAKSWGSWYEYEIKEPSEDNKYTIYLNDVVANMSTPPNQVGLYFEVKYYGPTKGLSANSHLMKGFRASDFTSWDDYASSAKLGYVTMSFTNSQRQNSNTTVQVGLTGMMGGNYPGTIQVTADSGYVIKEIEFTFSQAGGGISLTNGGGSYSGGTWTGSSSSVTFTSARSGQNWPRLSLIKVYYEPAS